MSSWRVAVTMPASERRMRLSSTRTSPACDTLGSSRVAMSSAPAWMRASCTNDTAPSTAANTTTSTNANPSFAPMRQSENRISHPLCNL